MGSRYKCCRDSLQEAPSSVTAPAASSPPRRGPDGAAVVVVGLSMLDQFSLIGLHPGFSVVLIGFSVLVLYALIARWEGPTDAYPGP